MRVGEGLCAVYLDAPANVGAYFNCLFGRSDVLACDCGYPPALAQSAELSVRCKHKVVGCSVGHFFSLNPDRHRKAGAARLSWIQPTASADARDVPGRRVPVHCLVGISSR